MLCKAKRGNGKRRYEAQGRNEIRPRRGALEQRKKLNAVGKGGDATLFAFTMPPIDGSKLVFTTVKCQNRMFEAIVDTGAEISVISPETCKLLKLSATQDWDGPLLVMANGTQTKPEGSINLEIIVGTIPVNVKAAILSINGFDLLLGNNALRQLRTVQVKYYQKGESIFFIKPEPELLEKNDEFCSIASGESRTIPAFSMVTVTVDVKKNKADLSNSRLINEPSMKVLATKGFSVGRLLLPVEEIPNVMTVQLVNFLRSNQWLNKGTVLGQVSPIEVMGEILGNKYKQTGPSIGITSLGESSLQFAESINKDLPPTDRQAVLDLLNKFTDWFASSDSELGRSNIVQHRIDNIAHPPIHQPPYRSAWKVRELIQSQVQDMLKDAVIELSKSPWASPVVLVKKSPGVFV